MPTDPTSKTPDAQGEGVPERVYLLGSGSPSMLGWRIEPVYPGDTEFVRADLYTAAIEAKERAEAEHRMAVGRSAEILQRIDALERELAEAKARFEAGRDEDPPFDAREFMDCFEKSTTEQIMQEAYELGLERGRCQLTTATAKLREMEGLRPEVLSFALLMEKQLRANDHKAGWRGGFTGELLDRLREETDELTDCIDALHTNPEEIGREAADVANFAMMVADVCGALDTALADEGDGERLP